MTPLEHALAYAALGWRVHSIPAGLKHPGRDSWQLEASSDPAWITARWTAHSDHGVCIATGPGSGIVAIDVDAYKPGVAEAWEDFLAAHGELPETVEAITGRGGRHLLFKHPAGEPIGNADHMMPPGVEVKSHGGQIVVAPTISPDSGRAYAWEVEHDPLDGYPVAEMPAWLVTLLRTPRPEQAARSKRVPHAGTDSIVDRFVAEHTWPELLVPAGWSYHSTRADRGGSYELWTRPGKQPRDGISASLYYQGSDVLKVFTSSAAPLAGGQTYTRFGFWAALHHQGDHSRAAGAYRREVNSAAGEISLRPTTLTEAGPEVADEAPDGPLEQPYTDLGNARRLVESHGHDLRWAPQFGSWLMWDGMRWAEDVTGEAHRRAKAVVDGFYTEMATTISDERRKKLFGHWMRSQSSGRIDAMVQLARTEPGVPVTVAELDGDPWLFNTRSGAIDLRSSTLSVGERRHLVTKLAPVAHDPAATCPTWRWFVDWAMQGDAELVGFLQRAVGYSLTGSVAEQCLFFLHGSGANGKSTFLNVVQRLAGDYALAAEADLLLATTHERHSTGIADLVGRRLVVVQETDDGRRLAEATVKQLTGGDTIRARRMRQDNFEFRPTHKLWMAANHRPMVRGTDHGIWRRIRMVPFLNAVAPDAQDPALFDKLLVELPGILNWALEGCSQWRHGGLRPPPAVLNATQEYRTEQDHIGRFLDDCCELANDVCVSARDLRAAYERWCEENGERPWSAKAMAPQLVDRGCERVKGGYTRAWSWVGVTLADRPELATAAMMVSRMAQANGSRADASTAPATHATHGQWVAGSTSLPGEMSHRDPCDPSACSPYAHAHTEGDTDNGSHGSRPASGTPSSTPDHDELELF